MAEFKLENYEQVKDRIPHFWEKYPTQKTQILTELLTPPDKVQCEALFKASLVVDGLIITTGFAYEKFSETDYVNKTSHVENCETSAIGRALANAGFSGYKSGERPSQEEMKKVQKHLALPDEKKKAELWAKIKEKKLESKFNLDDMANLDVKEQIAVMEKALA